MIIESQCNLGWKGAQAWRSSGSTTSSIWNVIISLIGNLMSPLLATSQNLFHHTSPEHYLVGVGLFVRLFVCLKNTFSLLFVKKQEIFSGSKYGGRWGERSMGKRRKPGAQRAGNILPICGDKAEKVGRPSTCKLLTGLRMCYFTCNNWWNQLIKENHNF